MVRSAGFRDTAIGGVSPVSEINQPQLPTRVVDLFSGATCGIDSEKGLELLRSCRPEHVSELPSYLRHHQIQQDLVLCGLASLTIGINSLGLDSRPIAEQYSLPGLQVRYATQQSLLDTLSSDERDQIQRKGMILDRLGKIARSCSAEASVHHAEGDLDVATFRKLAIESLTDPASRILVNYGRGALGQKGGGHFSPIAAYNEAADMFLIYDVAPWKADPLWVKSEKLFEAMATLDSDAGQNRGFLILRRPPDAPVYLEQKLGDARDGIVGLDCPLGLEYLRQCRPEHLTDFPKIMREHQIPEHLAQAGVASATILVNSLQLDNRPILAEYDRPDFNLRVPRMTQKAFMAELTNESPKPKARVGLDVLGRVVAKCGATVEVHHAKSRGMDLDRFRQRCIDAIIAEDSAVLVNYGALISGQKPAGHFSPLAAYNEEHDMFLIYDVAPWRADPFWIKADRLYEAMWAIDRSTKKNRGFMVVSR